MESNFKSGAGGLNFDEDDNGNDEDDNGNDGQEEREEVTDTGASQTESRTDRSTASRETSSRSGRSEVAATGSVTDTDHQYPYFVRRNKVGDERTERVEEHWRPEVKEGEGEFLTEVADELGTDEVAKTDAREFAHIVAHENPDLVAERMREDGYGET